MTSRARLLKLLGGSSAISRAAREAEAETIFVYGSQARGDYERSSDLEVGIVVPWASEGASAKFSKAISPSIPARYYTFERPKLEQGKPDVPFTRRIFVAELRASAITVFGEPVEEFLPRLGIRAGDLYEEHGFVRARILDGLVCARNGHDETAAALCWKGSYMAGRLFVLATDRVLISNRDALLERSWPGCVSELRSWMEYARSLEMIRRDPASVRGLLKVMTQGIYEVLDDVDEPIYLD